MNAGLAPLITVRSKEHARQQAEESLRLAKQQRGVLLDMIQAPNSKIKHNILDFGGPFEEEGENWQSINKTYLCEYVLVSLMNGSYKRSTNVYTPLSTDVSIGFPVTGDSLKMHTFFSMLKDNDKVSHAFLTLMGHAIDQVDTKLHFCKPIQDLEKFGNEVIAPIHTPSLILEETDENSDDIEFMARGGAGVGYSEDSTHETETIFKSFTCNDPWKPLLLSSGKVYETGMFDMISMHFSNDLLDGKPPHFTHGICITSKDFSDSPSKKAVVVNNRKMATIYHSMTPKNPNHCLATLVLKDSNGPEAYTHVAILDLGKGKKSHANMLSSFYTLAKSAVSAGSPGTNPFHISEGRIKEVKMTQPYDFAQVSNSLSFFYAPNMHVSLVSSFGKNFEVGMSVHSLRHLPQDMDVILGTPLVIDSLKNVPEWIQNRLENHVRSGIFPNLKSFIQ